MTTPPLTPDEQDRELFNSIMRHVAVLNSPTSITHNAIKQLITTARRADREEIASLKKQITYDTECIERITNHGLELEQEVERLKADLNGHPEPVMPGAWICDKCGFVLQNSNIYVKSGTIGADTKDECEGCPNDGTALRGLTWREANESMYERCVDSLKKLIIATAALELCESVIRDCLPKGANGCACNICKALAAIEDFKKLSP